MESYMLTKFLKKHYPESNFLKILENKRLSALIKLLLWGLFLLLIYLVIIIPGKSISKENITKKEEPETKVITYKNMEEDLLKYNFSYVYTISSDDQKVIYTGNYNQNTNTGFKEKDGIITKYLINEQGTFIYEGEDIVSIDTIYENINEDYLNLNNIFNIINNLDYEVNEEDELLIFNNNEEIYYLTIDNDKIKSIEIHHSNEIYKLEFDNIK